MKHRHLVEKFLHKAEQDLLVVKKWKEDSEIAPEILGFHAQQAAEKMLKAVLIAKGIDFPLTHRLTDLIDISKKHDINFPTQLEEIRFLNPFAVDFRYEIYEDDEEPVDLEGIFNLLTQLHRWVISTIFPEIRNKRN
jgi:HEPN domain-containing protein